MASCKDDKKNMQLSQNKHIPAVSAIEAGNKELITTIKKENKETRATIRKGNTETRKTLQKLAEEFPKMFVETKNNEACKSPILEKINGCTSQIVNVFAYKTKLQQHLYKTDNEVINTKKKMNSFWYQKHKVQIAVFFKQIEIEN